jgi:hypothetical protein
MNTRRLPTDSEYTTVPSPEVGATPPPTGESPNIQRVGRPWRYEFPHQPSSSDPERRRDFTVPMPEYVTNQTPGSPPEFGPVGRK